METIKGFINRNKVKMVSKMVDRRPDKVGLENFANSVHYRITLFCGKRQYTLYYSHGVAVCKDPQIDEVLECLASDCSADLRNFEAFCSEFGYDTDSRKAEAVYKAILKEKRRLEYLLGEVELEKLMYQTERL